MLLSKKILGTIAYLGGVEYLPEKFCWSFAQMVQYNTEYLCVQGEIVHYDRATVSYHSFARNTLVDKIRGDWLLMLDTDHSFEPDIAMRMLHTMNLHNIDILTGLYQYKQYPHIPTIYKNGEDKKGFQVIGDWGKDAEIFEVDSAGAGCLLVKKDVFKRIKEELNESPFDIIHPFSEDHSFFKRLEKLNIKTYCNPKIECYHLISREISIKDFDKEKVELSDRQENEGRILNWQR